MPDDTLDDAISRVDAALTAMRRGDPRPYASCWARSADVTLFGAWGPIEHGWREVTDTFDWVGSRFTGGDAIVEQTVVDASGDLAYTVGFERGPASVGGSPAREMVIRVTHIYKRDGGEWALVHRHADFPPEDQRQSRE
jgi:ketosteroid isomerase-like protein